MILRSSRIRIFTVISPERSCTAPHFNRSCTLNCDQGKKLITTPHIFLIVGFIAEILLDLDQLDCVYHKDIVA